MKCMAAMRIMKTGNTGRIKNTATSPLDRAKKVCVGETQTFFY